MKNNYLLQKLKQLLIIFSIGLFVLFSTDIFAQCDSITWSNPKPTGWNLSSVKFTDSNTGYASGNNGAVIKTIDGGSSWSLLKSNTSASLGSIFPVDASVVYTSGNGGVILKTTNGGANWQSANNGIINTASISLFFIDTNIGYAGGSSGDSAVLYKTINGGISWTAISTSFLPVGYRYISSLYFTSANSGYVLGNGKVYKTTDGSTFNILNTNPAQTYSNITFTDANTGYIGGNISGLGNAGGLAKTTDGGLTWNDLITNINDFNVFVSAIDFPTPNIGYVLASHKKSYILKTTDAGVTWAKVDSSSGFNSIGDYNDLDFISTSTGIAVGTFGRILQTTNGAHFTDVSGIARNFLTSVQFPSSDVGYAIHSGVSIAKTIDQGNNWGIYDSVSTAYLNDLYFTDINTGYAVGANGTILKTTSGGTVWTPQVSHTLFNLSSIQFTNVSIGYAAGDTGALLKTIDGGVHWNALNSTTTDYIKDIFFIDSDTGYFISNTAGLKGPNGSIFKTKDGGITWIKQDYNTSNILNTIHFPDAMHGYVGAGGGLLAKTSNAGASWQIIDTHFSAYNVTSIKFKDANTGFATLERVSYGPSIRSSYGIIIKTTDGGIHWNALNSEIYPGLTSLDFANSSIGFAVGDESTILKFQLSGSPFGEIQGPARVCALGSATYSVANISGATYNWSLSGGGTISGSGNSISINWTSAGTYVLTLTPATTSCGSLHPIARPVTIDVLPKPVLSASGVDLTSDAAYGNTWYLDGQLIPNETRQTYTATQNGDYTVQVVLNGCTSEFSNAVSLCICATGVSKNSLGEQFNIYPNPSHGNFTLGFSKAGNYEVKVINALGEQLWAKSVAEAESIINLPADLKGIFYMQIRSEKGVSMQKILLE